MCSRDLKAKAERLWAHVFNIIHNKIIFFSLFSVLDDILILELNEACKK